MATIQEQISFIEARLKISQDHLEWRNKHPQFYNDNEKNYAAVEVDLLKSVKETLVQSKTTQS